MGLVNHVSPACCFQIVAASVLAGCCLLLVGYLSNLLGGVIYLLESLYAPLSWCNLLVWGRWFCLVFKMGFAVHSLLVWCFGLHCRSFFCFFNIYIYIKSLYFGYVCFMDNQGKEMNFRIIF